MAERVYHVQSTGQLVVLTEVTVRSVLHVLETKQEAIERDVVNLREWLREKEEECSSRRMTGDSSRSSSVS